MVKERRVKETEKFHLPKWPNFHYCNYHYLWGFQGSKQFHELLMGLSTIKAFLGRNRVFVLKTLFKWADSLTKKLSLHEFILNNEWYKALVIKWFAIILFIVAKHWKQMYSHRDSKGTFVA